MSLHLKINDFDDGTTCEKSNSITLIKNIKILTTQ